MSVGTTAGILSAVAAATSIGTSIYGATQSGGGGYVAPIVKPKPIDLQGAAAGAGNIAKIGYDLSDADLATRLPGLVTGNKALIDDTYKQLTGPLDPHVQNAFTQNGVIGALRSGGGGDALAGLGEGSGGVAKNEVSRSVATQVLGKQDQDRANLDTLLSQNPERSLTITGGQAANLDAFTTQQTNEYNFAKYQQDLQKEAQSGGGGGF